MAGNQVTLTFAGDAGSATAAIADTDSALDRLDGALADTGRSTQVVVAGVGSAEDAFESMARESGALGAALDRVNGAASILSGGIGDVGGAMTAVTDLQNLAKNKALEHEQALLDVEGAQAAYTQAVKEFGEGSMEARQAALDLKSAQAAAEPPTKMAEWGEKLELISPIIMGVVGATDLLILANTALSASWIKNAAAQVGSKIALVASTIATGVATAAQWLLNIAMMANPIGLIIAGILLLVGVIILIATKTTWFQDLWRVTWSWIKDAASATWDWLKSLPDKIGGAFARIPGLLKSAFGGLVSIITWPFRTGFNFVSDIWNNTIGKLSWTVPSWVPVVGGKSISAPKLPHFHAGIDRVPGPPGSEMLAVLQAGERVTPAGQSDRTVIEIRSGGAPFDDLLVQALASAIRRKGGDPIVVLTSG